LRALFYLVVSTTAHFLFAPWVLSVFPSARVRRRLVFAIAAVLSLLLPIMRLAGLGVRARWFHVLSALPFVELAILVVGLVPLAIVVAGTRAASRVLDAVNPPDGEAAKAERISRREAIERVAGVAALGATGAVLGWGIVRGRHAFEIEEVEIRVAGWPRALDGYVIAQVSDIHVGSWVGERELDEGFEVVRRVRPDLVVATGDLVDRVAHAIDPLLARLASVGARDGAYAILGNHDHYASAEKVAARIATSEVRLLANEAVRIRAGDSGGFVLAGVDDLLGRRRRSTRYAGPDLGRALAGTPPDLPRVLLAHQPVYFRESQGRVAVQLSGHTHGGQINPGVAPVRALMEFVAGRYERAGSTLWVNRGFGVVGPPARVGAPPEVTKVVLVSA
jgi:predicted MPP superfamily phosphohydrolase